MSADRVSARSAGVLVPLFSVPSSSSWGIGEIPDLVHVAAWCRAAGCSVLQLLPINELPQGETSPYSSMSAMAIDPQFIAVHQVDEFVALGGEEGLDPQSREVLASVRGASRVDYGGVRALKDEILRHCFARFEQDRRLGTPRAAAFDAWCRDEAWWLDDYALFRALHAAFGERAWTSWPQAVRTRQVPALAAARDALADDITYRKYLQWLASAQWSTVRTAVRPVRLFGDLPFMVGSDSADVWARQDEFRMDVSVGVPPDAFSETGQDWRLPLYRWDVFAERDFDWFRERARRYDALHDGYRVDHLVGFYRTFYRPHDGSPAAFSPGTEPEQVQLGERVLGVFRASGACIIAEDLGVVPDFVRASLTRLGVPGYRVFRWERQWQQEGQPFIDPVDFPPTSVATTGTHDTEPLVLWWEAAPPDERQAVLNVASVAVRLTDAERAEALTGPTLTVPLRLALLEALFASGADFLILPLQDVFGWRDRINRPATVGSANWTWRLPWPAERLSLEPEAVVTARALLTWASRHGRSVSGG
jgi:4-alpha-glucanotransferase